MIVRRIVLYPSHVSFDLHKNCSSSSAKFLVSKSRNAQKKISNYKQAIHFLLNCSTIRIKLKSISLLLEFLSKQLHLHWVNNSLLILLCKYTGIDEGCAAVSTRIPFSDTFLVGSGGYLQILSCLATLYRAENISIQGRKGHLIEVINIEKTLKAFLQRHSMTSKQLDWRIHASVVRLLRVV